MTFSHQLGNYSYGYTHKKGIFKLLSGNKKKIIHFWASWCAPCLEELPFLIKSIDAKSHEFELILYGVNDNRLSLRKALDASGFNRDKIVSIFDQRGFAESQFGVFKIPETRWYDRKGFLAKRVVGKHDWNNL